MANKTVKYEMYINTPSMSGIFIPISKKEFQRQVNYYEKLIADNHEEYKKEIEELKEEHPNYWMYTDIEGCLSNMEVTTEMYEKYIVRQYAFCDNGTALLFRELTCKEGYHWKSRKESIF